MTRRPPLVLALLAALAACDLRVHLGAPLPAASEGSPAPTVCQPGSTRPCYDGPPETLGVGVCQAGTETCEEGGLAYGPCAGEVLPSMPACSSTLDVACEGAPGCHGVPLWNVALAPSPTQVVFDPSGGAAVMFGGADQFVSITKLGPDGAEQWTWQSPSDVFFDNELMAGDAAGDLALDADFDGSSIDLGDGPETFPDGQHTLILVLDPTGKLLWHYVTAVPWSQGPMMGPVGEVTVLGDTGQDVDGSMLPADGTALAHFDATGTHQWTQSLSEVEPNGVASLPDGSLILDGASTTAVDLGGGPIGGGDVPFTYLAGLTPGGAYAWAQLAGDTVSETIAVGGDRLARAGVYASPQQGTPLPGDLGFGHGCPAPDETGYGFFVAGHDLTGDLVWSRCFTGDMSTALTPPAVGPSGELAIGGTFAATAPVDLGGGPLLVNGAIDVLSYPFVGLYDASGALLWARRLGAAQVVSVTAVGVASSGDVLVAGSFSGSLDLGAGPLMASPSGSAFVARLAR